MMKKYTIAIEETIVEEFEVDAKDCKMALDIAAEKYRKGEFVLCCGEVQFKQMAIVKQDSDFTEWKEF